MRRVLGLIALTVIIGWLISVFAPSPSGDVAQVAATRHSSNNKMLE
jgi:hypothetical protein